MSEPFVAEIRIVSFNFAPRGWAFCDGQLLPISQNTALFSLLGTTYGGNGMSNFALPDLRGCAPMHPGQGPGLSPRHLGEAGGQKDVTLIELEMPAHRHTVMANAGIGTAAAPGGNDWAISGGRRGGLPIYASTASSEAMAPQALATAGGSQPHNNMPPYLALNFVIALQGLFPPRD